MNPKTRLSRIENRAARNAKPEPAIVAIQDGVGGPHMHAGHAYKDAGELRAAHPGKLLVMVEVYDGKEAQP